MPTNPPPPWAPLEVAADEERAWPPIQRKRFPCSVYRVFGGMARMARTWENLLAACVGIHYLLILVNMVSYAGGEQAGFWRFVSRVVQYLCYASTTLFACVFVRCYMRAYGEHHAMFDPPQQHLAPPVAAEEQQLPPPPPEMDMC